MPRTIPAEKPTAIKSWLWPDRTIGKRESRVMREEHNALVNHAAQLAEALQVAKDVLAERGVELKEITRALARWEKANQ